MLEVRKLTKRFGGLTAVNNLSFEVERGLIVGLIGPNGAGKTTVFNLLSGYHKPSEGDIIFNKKKISGMKPNKIASRGLVRTFQLVNLVKNGTAISNLLAGYHLQRRAGILATIVKTNKARSEEQELWDKAIEILKEMKLDKRWNQSVSSLPHGNQKALGMAIALAAKPTMILLDEPTAGMNATELASVIKAIHRTRETGVTVMLVEHDLKMVMGVCDRVIVMNFGHKISEGTPEEVSKNEEVIKAYLGYDETNRSGKTVYN